MKSAWIDKEICYDGTQLSSHWIYRETGEMGDAIAAFIGPADVPLANMVDLEDVRNSAPISSRVMLHFIVEHFDCGLNLAIARQRLLAAIAAERIRRAAPELERRGDDLYVGDRKLSVSIATASPVSALIHFAMNIESGGVPVPAIGLADLNVEPRRIADEITRCYRGEIASMDEARCKVRAVE